MKSFPKYDCKFFKYLTGIYLFISELINKTIYIYIYMKNIKYELLIGAYYWVVGI
jgi:hypothetical protein